MFSGYTDELLRCERYIIWFFRRDSFRPRRSYQKKLRGRYIEVAGKCVILVSFEHCWWFQIDNLNCYNCYANIPLEPSVVLYTYVDGLLMIKKMYDSLISVGHEHPYVKKGNSRDAISSNYILQARGSHVHICSPSQTIRKWWYDIYIISFYAVMISGPCVSLKW